MSTIKTKPMGAILVAVSLFAGMALVNPSARAASGTAAACASLARLAFKDATVDSAKAYARDEFHVPARNGQAAADANAPSGVPGFCRVQITLRPSSDSDIKMEVWLPMDRWNGKFVGVANFGTGGVLQYQNMVPELSSGYALAANDTGHSGAQPDFAVGHPEKMIDYAYRADHEMTVKAKQVIASFYGKGARRSIWVGCSLGGVQALIEAKRYPADYDGIVAGAPPNPLPTFNAEQIWGPWLNLNHPEGAIPAAKFAMIHQAALQACGTPVGLAQGFIEDPMHCQFGPASLLCKGADGPDCLTAAQIERLRQLYEGPRDPRSGKVIFPGPNVGAEAAFANPDPPPPPVDLYRYMVFEDPHWEWQKSMNFTTVVDEASRKLDPLLVVDPDLSAFVKRGGKLMLYLGLTEGHNGHELIAFYEQVLQSAGPAAARSVRLFLSPGMNHCGGGAGCDTFERSAVVDRWLETGKAPDQILSSKLSGGKVVRTRPLCAYPAVARYTGAGSMDDAANFKCAEVK